MALPFCRSAAVLLVLLASLGVPSAASAAPTLIGDSVLIEFLDTGFGDFDDSVIVGAGVEIAQGDGSSIGTDAMTGTEFVNIGALAIAFGIFGGGDVVVDAPPDVYRGTGLDAGARYHISGLFDPAAAIITGVSVAHSNLLAAPTVLFDAHSVTLQVGDLAILETAFNLGLVTLTLQVQELEPSAVPEPATLLLVGAGTAAAGIRRYRARGRSSRAA